MSRRERSFSSVWDGWLLQSILLSFGLTQIDAASRSLVMAWIVCCCDIAFIIDTFARGFHKASEIFQGLRKIRIGVSNTSLPGVLSNWLRVFSFVSLFPYHILYIWHMDTGGYYLIVCLMRILWFFQSKRSCFAYLNGQRLRQEYPPS